MPIKNTSDTENDNVPVRNKTLDPEKEYSDKNRTDFYDVLDGKMDKKIFLKKVMPLHFKQWSSFSYNIIESKKLCRNDCAYCYMKPMFKRFNRNMDDIEDQFVSNTLKVNKKWKKVNDNESKVYMFPSSHDIFPESVDDYITVAKKIMDANHKVVCVSKPRLLCITEICDKLNEYKDKFLFRFTITTDNNDYIQKLEGNSPLFEERLECLKYAYEKGYKTSISMEPFISEPYGVIEKCERYVTKNIWIGTMSGMECLQNNSDSIIQEEYYRLVSLYDKNNLHKIVLNLRNNSKIYWKTSIMRIIFLH